MRRRTRRDPFLSDEHEPLRLRRGQMYYALDRFLTESEFAGMLIAVANALDLTREMAVREVGLFANKEGRSFEESLVSLFWLYTDGRIPKVEPYRGRVACRGAAPVVAPAPPVQLKTGRVPSRGL